MVSFVPLSVNSKTALSDQTVKMEDIGELDSQNVIKAIVE